jgi:hypothetical protein
VGAELDILAKAGPLSAELDLVAGAAKKGAEQAVNEWRMGGSPVIKRVDVSGKVTAAQAGLATPTAFFPFMTRPQTGRLWEVKKVVLQATGATAFATSGISTTATTFSNNNQTTAPGSFSVLASVNPPAGNYRVVIEIGFGAGTPVAADGNNWRLQSQGLTVSDKLWAPLVANGTGPLTTYVFDNVQADGSNAIVLTNPVAGTGGVQYVSNIEATLIPGTGATSAALFVTGQPGGLANLSQNAPNQDVDVTGLTLPVTQFFSSHQLWVRGNDWLVAGFQGAGLTTGLTIQGHARVIEIDDDPRFLTLL